MFLRVKEFHRVFGQNISEHPNLPVQSERDLRRRLLEEEVNEFCKAYHENDMVEMADGLADICYIIAGTCVSYGICPESVYQSPYEDVIDQMTLFYNLKLHDIVIQDFFRYEKAEQDHDLPAIKDTLMTLMASVFGIALHLGIPLNAVFDEVHTNNMSKVGADGKPKYRGDGKLLKPDGWLPPDIKGVLERWVNNSPT